MKSVSRHTLKFNAKQIQSWRFVVLPLLAWAFYFLYIWFNYTGRSFADQALQKIINQRIASHYSIHYGTLKFDLWEKKLQLEGLTLMPDSIPLNLRHRKWYQLDIPEIDIQLKSLMPIFQDRSLIIEGLSITNPEIVVLDYSSENKPTVTSESISLFETLVQYLDLFKINFLEIQQGGFAYWKKQAMLEEVISLNNIDFSLQHFILDSTMAKHDFLNAEYIELNITDQQLYLPDQLHQLSFDHFRLSTQDSLVTFNNLQLQPIDSSILTDKSLAFKHHLFDIQIPQLDLSGIDFQDSYLHRDLRADSLSIQAPQVFVQQRKHPKNKKGGSNNALVGILQKAASILQIHNIQLDQAKVLFTKAGESRNQLGFDLDYLHLSDFYLDTNHLFFDKKTPPVKAFDCKIQNLYKSWPNKHGYTLRADQLHLDTKKAFLEAQQLHFKPKSTTADIAADKFVQFVPLIRMNQLNFYKFIFDGELEVNQLFLDQPSTKLISSTTPPDSLKQAQFSFAPIHEILKTSAVKRVKNQRMIIRDGSFQLDDSFSIGSYQFDNKGFQLYGGTQSIQRMCPDFSLVFQNVIWEDTSQMVEVKEIQTDGTNHQLKNAQLITSSLDLNLDAIYFFEGPIDSLVKQQLVFDSIHLDRLQAKVKPIKENHQTLGNWFQPIRLPVKSPAIGLTDASLEVGLSDGGQLAIPWLQGQLVSDSTLMLNQLSLKDLNLNLTQLSHQLKISALHQFGSGYSFKLENIKLIPTDTNLNLRAPIHVPECLVIQLNRNKFYQEKALSFQKIVLEKPALQLFIKRDSLIAKNDTTTNSFADLEIDTLSIRKAGIRLSQISGKDSSQFNAPQTSIEIMDLNTKGLSQNWKNFIDHFSSLTLESDTMVSFTNEKLGMKLYSPKAQLPAGNFTLSQIRLRDSANTFSSDLKNIQVMGLDVSKLTKQAEVQAESFIVNQTKLLIKTPATKAKASQATFSKSFELGRPVSFQHFHLKDLNFNLIQQDTFSLPNIELQAKNLALDSVIQLQQLDQAYQGLHLDLPNIQHSLGKYEEYALSYSLHFDSYKNQLIAKNIQLNPKFDRQAYSGIIENQTDHFDVSLDSISLHGFSPADLFKDSLTLHRVQVHQLDADIFRDRNVPRLDQQTPLVQSQIKAIPHPFYIDSLLLTGNFSVTELPANRQEPTVVTFNQIKGTLGPITNMKTQLDKAMILSAEGKLYNTGKFNTYVNFTMNDNNDAFTMSGEVQPMDIQPFNALLIPGARIHVKSGRNKGLTFNMSANNEHAIGEMIFKYNKLKFLIATKEDINKVNFGNSILSFWANRLVRSRNPSFLKKRTGIIYFERDPNKAIFNYWAKSLLSGVVSSVGVKNNKKKLKLLGEENLRLLHYHELFSDPIKIKPKTAAAN